MKRLRVEGLICIGGDGTLSGMQVLSDYFPTVLAPKTIDNDLGLNYRHEPDEWQREPCERTAGLSLRAHSVAQPVRSGPDDQLRHARLRHGRVRVGASGVQRIRTTAESHRRIAIVEVMGRHSGYLALGAAYGQPDIVLIPEVAAQRRSPRRARHRNLRAAKKRRHRLRRGSRGRERAGTGRRCSNPPIRPATRFSPARPRPCGRF